MSFIFKGQRLTADESFDNDFKQQKHDHEFLILQD